MNGYNYDILTYNMEYSDHCHFSNDVPKLPSPMIIPGNDFTSISMLAMNPELGYCSSSACSSNGSPSSMNNYVAENMSFYPLVSSPTAFNTESYSNSVGKVDDYLGTYMVQRSHRSSESPLSNEASILECMNKTACKYSPEEKRERIEKYRNKKNLRNFNKKIKYECRKTLADSRPHTRGRFAKNGETIERTSGTRWGVPSGGEYQEEYEYDDNFLNLLDVYSVHYCIP